MDLICNNTILTWKRYYYICAHSIAAYHNIENEQFEIVEF